jgi:hypothetical protein
MRGWAFLFIILVACADSGSSIASGTSERSDPSVGTAEVGLNLASVSYYATQTPFADVFRNRDAWVSTDGTSWDTDMADAIATDADGYPLALPSQGQMLRASAFLPVRADSFVMTWQGDGTLSVKGSDFALKAQDAHSLTFSLSRSLSEPVFVTLERSQAADHVHQIEIRASKDYDASFKAALSGFGVLRFMDWGATNGNPVSHWSERTTALQAQGSARGTAIETMVDTANQFHADMWYSVPHQADDDFIQQAAQLISTRLDPALKVYVEYSNENWNGIFPQAAWEQARGLDAGLNKVGVFPNDDDDSGAYWAGLKYAMRRAARVHTSFRAALGDERVVAVVSGQSGFSDLNDQLLVSYEDVRVNPLGGHPDALAVAPYFGRVYQPDQDNADDLTVERLLSDAEAAIADSVARDTAQNHAVARAHHVRLIAYEAGQHILATGGLENDMGLVERTIAANRDPRMGDLYRKAQRAWQDHGGELAVYFNSCEAPGKYGSWGALEYQDESAADAPKWAALRALAAAGH